MTVVSRESGLADAAATALYIAGPQHWQSLAKQLKLKQVLFIDQYGQIEVTPDLMARLSFTEPRPEKIRVTEQL